MDVGFRPRMSKDEVQKIIDDRLSLILEKELQQANLETVVSEKENADSSRRKSVSQNEVKSK